MKARTTARASASPIPVSIFALLTLFGLVGAVTAAETEAQDPVAGTEVKSSQGSAGVGLDKLLKLPNPSSYVIESPAGDEREEWEARFAVADADLEQARSKLRESQAKMDELSESATGWQMAPPGMQAGENGTASYQLMQEIRDNKKGVAKAERRRRELTVEASLADVPEEWYSPKDPSIEK